ncbi:hypothetical protein D3C76_451410 [compost metagenome]
MLLDAEEQRMCLALSTAFNRFGKAGRLGAFVEIAHAVVFFERLVHGASAGSMTVSHRYCHETLGECAKVQSICKTRLD